MTPIDVRVPPQLEAAIGWTGGESRWLAMCWSSCGDCPWMDDGRSSMTGHPWGYLAWRRHPAVAPALGEADLGNSNRDGTQRLVVDRENRRVYLSGAAEARAVVRGQWPAEDEAADLTALEWKDMAERVRQMMLERPLPSMGELMRQLQDHSRLVAAMIRWLDSQVAERAGVLA